MGKYQSGMNTNGELLGFRTIITPSKEKLKIHYDQVSSIIDDHKAAPQTALISRLNPVIPNWSNYYSTVVSKESFSALDHLMYLKLKRWAKRRHPNKSREWVAKKYWQTIGGNHWAFATRQEGKSPLRLRTHAETPIVRHVKVKGEASPYDGNQLYWSSRMGKHPEVSTRVATLLKTQKGKCTHCGLYFREEDVLEVDHIIPRSKGGKDEYKNLQILHRHCHNRKTAEDGSVGSTHEKRQIIEEPDEVKVCAVVRADRIANKVGWSSGQLTPRRTTNLDPKGRGDKSMFVKREVTEGVYVTVPQRLSDMAKAKLLKFQCPVVVCTSFGSTSIHRCCR